MNFVRILERLCPLQHRLTGVSNGHSLRVDCDGGATALLVYLLS